MDSFDDTDKEARVRELRRNQRRNARNLRDYLRTEEIELDAGDELERLHELRIDVEKILERAEKRLDAIS